MHTPFFRSLLIACFIAVLPLSFVKAAPKAPEDTTILDELDPFAPDIEETLQRFDKEQEAKTGMPSWDGPRLYSASDCYRESCPVFAYVAKNERPQLLYLFRNGQLIKKFPVSTGLGRRATPNFDTHPSGRIYDKYTSSKYPEGDFQGLGNMPFAVFIYGGFAIHGTTAGNFKFLGQPASHGCIRLHPSHAYYFNRLVRMYGAGNTWITVQ